MSELITKLTESWPVIVVVLISIINALIDTYKGRSAVVRWLNVLIDALSVTTRKDAEGTFKLPIKQSVPVNTTKKKR